MSEIVIESEDSGVTVYVWDKFNTGDVQPIGAYTLEKTKAESVEKAKELATLAIAKDRDSNIDAVRKDIDWQV